MWNAFLWFSVLVLCHLDFMWGLYRVFLSPLEEVFTEIWRIINQNMFLLWAYETFFSTFRSNETEGKYCALIYSEGKHMSIRDFSNVSFLNFSFNTCLINCNWKTQTLYLGPIPLPKQYEKILLVRIFKSHTQLI